MRIVKVIHGYPRRYNAGSEVYSQMLCQGLAQHHEVHVFTRQEDPFSADYAMQMETDDSDPRIRLHLINLPGDRHRFRYRHAALDERFAQLLDDVKPHIVHIGHLNHLSTALVHEAYRRNIPVLFTLHDYWLMCPRGQFMQYQGARDDALWPVCDGQENRKCAVNCYAGFVSGAALEWEQDINYWEDWVARRMEHIREITRCVDYFIAPSYYLYQRFVDDFQLPPEKIRYLDYGFDLRRFAAPRQRPPNEVFTFGYIGTHIPAKGIQLLIKAFAQVKGDCLLRIWGRATPQTAALKSIVNTLPAKIQARIEWMGEYNNQHIMTDVFNKTDCIVVPSIWVENSPLVIHEALQARLPVITANVGGMAEYIQHEVNGLLFQHRDIASLAAQMQRLADEPQLAVSLGQRGYLAAEDGNIPDMVSHVKAIEQLYQSVIARRTIA